MGKDFQESSSSRRSFRRIITALLLGAVFSTSLALNLRGIDWARLAPDEHRIASWMASLDDGEKVFIKKRVYPEGLFVLAKAIRFFERECEKISGRTSKWQGQRAENIQTPDQERPPRFNIVRLRRINAWLGALASAFVFLALVELFGGPLPAAAASLLFACHPLVVEHAHYAETDMMMMFMGALALWAMTVAAKRASAAVFLCAAFLVGGAIASKFSLMPMLLILPANAAAIAANSRRGAARPFAARLLVASLAVAALGFFAFTPKLWHDPALYLSQCLRIKVITYSEIHGILGEAASRRGAALAYKLRSLSGAAARGGVALLLAAALSIPLWCARRFRPAVCAVPLFGLLYLVTAPLCFPWFRSQEFLPAIPFFAASAIVPLLSASRCRSGLPRIAATAAALALLLAAAGHVATAGIRMSDAFASIETRYAAAEWLDRSAPDGKTFVTEFYATAGTPSFYLREGANRVESTRKIEKIPPRQWDEIDCDYFLRAENYPGRGIYDPFTGKLFPSRQANLDHAMADARAIGRWSIRDGIAPTFAQSDIVLYANHAASAPELDLEAFIPQPAIVKSKWYRNPEVRIPLNSGLVGPLKAVQLLNVRTEVEFEPLPEGERWFAVAANHNRRGDVRVEWGGGFSPDTAAVPAQGACLFVSDDSLASHWKAIPETCVKMLEDDHANLCTAFFTRSPAVAAGLLRLFGNEEAAAGLAPSPSDEALDKATALLPDDGTASGKLFINGMPSTAIRDFARITIFNPPTFVVPDTPQLARYNDAFLYAKLPFAIGGDPCTLRIVFRPSRLNTVFAGGADAPNGLFHVIGARLLSAKVLGVDSDLNLKMEFRIAGGRPYSPIFLGIKNPDETIASFESSSMVLEWNPAEMLRHMHSTPPNGDR